jgi:N4-gp56 family major capsid protein
VENVEIPVAGDVSAAKSGDPSTLPLQVEVRQDDKKSYPVEPLYHAPVLVRREEQIVLNYNKLTDVVSACSMSINTRAGNIAATNWGADPAVNTLNSVYQTTGTSRASTVTGTTGNRKGIAKNDMLYVKKAFNKMNLPNLGKGSLFGLLTPEQVDDLLKIPEFVDYDKTGEFSKLINGEIGFIAGFNLMMRNNDLGHAGVMYSEDATLASIVKRGVDEAIQATDNAAAIFWHASMVRHAEGNAATIINRNVPGYLGGAIIENVVRFGATFDRPDQKGIFTLIEDNV